jgi:hypothetical protein
MYLQVNVDYSANQEIILAGKYQPNPDEGVGPFCGHETISEVWPEKPSSGFINVFVRLPSSQY